VEIDNKAFYLLIEPKNGLLSFLSFTFKNSLPSLFLSLFLSSLLLILPFFISLKAEQKVILFGILRSTLVKLESNV